ncbi:hypothetical protein BJ875DRAFT_475800 [Amylocarpus encephaloides]|uniref:DUF3984 domain-containing protein n=1 Tax=Amylocarpus encephaloides TaxID=45428 RepID=A0A9P7Y976_9HELO|nr:hypothetical protein BJ875DRAFT_475800 [Amylocarpus encephaloides]
MDIAYNQHSPYSRHHDRSHTNLNHITLAPFTSRLPLSDPDALPDSNSYSYIEGRSAPTTPSILSRSSSRVSMPKPANISISKSKSSTHLLASTYTRSGMMSPSGTKLRKTTTRNESGPKTFSELDRSDSDWLLRAGATMSTSARESKGQAWLVSRASSTSLTAQRHEEDEELEQELIRERSRASRGGSVFDADDEFSTATTRRSLSFDPHTGAGSHPGSRFQSRGNSRRGSRANLFTPMAMEREGYFDPKHTPQHEFAADPDFVGVEEEGFEHEEDAKDDEAVVRKLARASSVGLVGWVERMLGWSLFAVEEDGEEAEGDAIDEKAEDSEISSRASRRTFDGPADPADTPLPPRDDEGGWQDAAWLLSVATKVLL